MRFKHYSKIDVRQNIMGLTLNASNIVLNFITLQNVQRMQTLHIVSYLTVNDYDEQKCKCII